MILIVTQCFPPKLGGIETLMGGLADALAARGEEVVVLADGDASDAEIRAHDAAKPYRVQRFSGWKPLRARAKARAARRLIGDASCVYVDSWKSVERLPGRGSAPDARVHCLAHGMEFPAQPTPSKGRRIARAFARVDRIHASSDWTAAQARPFASETPIAVTPPPLPAPPEAAEPAAAPDWGLDGADPMVVTLCRLEPRKGVDRVIDAVAALSKTHPGIALAIAGGGPDRERLEALAATTGLGERIRFLGRITDAEKAALLARADIFAMPSRREGNSVEGFGIVYLEAGWFGAPSIAGREGGAATAVLDGETGLLCDGSDPASVREALERLVTDADLRARLGDAARRHAAAQLWNLRIADYLA